jgi:hypothetical protein
MHRDTKTLGIRKDDTQNWARWLALTKAADPKRKGNITFENML